MKVREESTSQPGEKNPKHQDGAAADPACRQLPQAERKPEYRQTRVLQERKHSIQREGGGRQPGSGEGCITCFEDKLWVEDFCGYRVDFFLSPCARIEGEVLLPVPPPFCYFRLKQTCAFSHSSALGTEFNEVMHVKVLSKLIFIQGHVTATGEAGQTPPHPHAHTPYYH